MKISVQKEDFDLGLEVLDIQQDNRIGAVASFVGQVRDVPMTLEHYPGMTENAIKKIVEEARAQWQIIDYTVIHRFGDLQPNDQIVLVAIASSASRRRLRRLPVHHGLPQDAGAVLEEGASRRRRALGQRAGIGRSGRRALEKLKQPQRLLKP